MSDLETAKRIYFERCDNASKLPERFSEEEVWDLMVLAIMVERERGAKIADEHAELAAQMGRQGLYSGPGSAAKNTGIGIATAIRSGQ